MKHKLGKKTKVVCFGGGTGMPSLLRGLKKNPNLDVTAVVSMFDNGGSSGELKDKFGILPPGDILKCLLALAEDDASARSILLRRIDHRKFPGHIPLEAGRPEAAVTAPSAERPLMGHTGGNVLLMGLEKVYEDYRDAVHALGQILSVRGTVVPVALTQGTLCARHKGGKVSKGEIMVDTYLFDGHEVEELFLEPRVEASPEALAAIKEAHVFCIGPGSFYTSIMPNFLPEGIREGLRNSQAPIIFISNLLTEGMGMQGYTVPRVVDILETYIGRSVDAVIVNTKVPSAKVLDKYKDERKHPLLMGVERTGALDPRFVPEDLWLNEGIARHDSERLASAVSKVIEKVVK